LGTWFNFECRFLFQRRKRTRKGRQCWSTIEDRQFAEFIQFYLHKCGQITLDEAQIYTNNDVPMFVNNAEMELPLAEVAPISQNIKSFQKITIRFVVHFFLLIKII
jgi:hypothetical protein